MIFINTRPASRAKPLTNFLQSQGISVLALPLLELIPCELSNQEKIYLKNLTQPNTYQALIFISETAVTYFFDFINHHQISLNPSLVFIAVGQKTADIFKNCWQKISDISPNVITPSQFNLPENNEGLLQLPLIQTLKKEDKILLLKGKDGRELLKNSLVKNDIIVHEVDFYQRIFPSQSEQIFQQFIQHQAGSKKTVVLLTSLTAWHHWQQLLLLFPNTNLALHYLILQPRIAESVAKSGVDFTVLASLEPKEILEKLTFLA